MLNILVECKSSDSCSSLNLYFTNEQPLVDKNDLTMFQFEDRIRLVKLIANRLIGYYPEGYYDVRVFVKDLEDNSILINGEYISEEVLNFCND